MKHSTEGCRGVLLQVWQDVRGRRNPERRFNDHAPKLPRGCVVEPDVAGEDLALVG